MGSRGKREQTRSVVAVRANDELSVRVVTYPTLSIDLRFVTTELQAWRCRAIVLGSKCEDTVVKLVPDGN